MSGELSQLKLKEFVYYDALPLRAPAHLVDSKRPFPPPADDYADGSWTDWLDTDALTSSPYLSEIIAKFSKHTKVTLVRLLRLAPGAIVKEHTDPTLGIEVKKSVIRLTIPISGNDQTDFYLNDQIVPMTEGECWYLRLSDPHRVVNNGTDVRINLTIDLIPNQWIRSLLSN